MAKGLQNKILKKNNVGGLTLFDLKSYYESIVIKTLWHWHKVTQSNETNKKGS